MEICKEMGLVARFTVFNSSNVMQEAAKIAVIYTE